MSNEEMKAMNDDFVAKVEKRSAEDPNFGKDMAELLKRKIENDVANGAMLRRILGVPES